jgi:MtrB/PioB family decaheme-associated outer membrane protein
MKTTKTTIILALALLLFATVARAQDATKPATTPGSSADTNADNAKPERGTVEFGLRQVWGDVYGRPDLPFKQGIQNSKYNEYRDIRNGFFLRRAVVELEDFLGSPHYVGLQSRNSVYKDQSYLATLGRWGKYKLQFRYDEIPHTFTNTSRTLLTTMAPGVFTISPLVRSSLQTSQALTTLPNTIQTQVVPGMQFFTPELERRNGALGFAYEPSADWTVWTSVMREHMSGSRPLGAIFNSSPSASTTGGDGVEIPEPINYFTTNFRVGTEYGRESWAVQLSYLGSFFENRITTVTFDNPFRTTDCVSPNGCTSATQGPAVGRLDLYPDNSAHYLTFAGAYGLNKKIHLMASINPGWLRQNDRFVPYTSNSILQAMTGPLPSSSLDGKKTTLAMNYTVVANPFKRFQVKAGYRHYDYNNDTPVRSFTPVEGDFSAPNLTAPVENTPWSYNRKTFEATGTYYFGKKSSFKAGYVGDWMDRTHRDVAHSLENAFITSLDLVHKDFSFRVAYRHAVRNPDTYVDDHFALVNASGGITEEQVNHRRFDEAARTRDRFEAQASWNANDRLTFTAFGGSTQDNYNRRGGVNSPTPLNFLPATTNPYYLYGVLKDIGNNYGVDADFSLSAQVSLFAEYSHELYHKRMVSRNRSPGSGIPDGVLVPSNCGASGAPCDSANNDWQSTARDHVDIWTIGTDLYLGKKVYFTTYYSLSAGKGHVDTRPLGDPTLTTGPNKFALNGTSAAVNYPETTNRLHEVVAIFKFHVTKNIMPRFEYRYQQWDYKDYQSGPMTPYMGCVSPIPNGPPVTNTVPGCTVPILNANVFNPVGSPSPFYPYFTVGDPSAARYLFLGADQPSYHAHYVAATVEIHF